MTTASCSGWTCGKCGRGGLTSVTVLGGIYLCGLCSYEMQLQAKANPGIPLDGPGSHAWDLREMQVQRDRADRAEARAQAADDALREWVGSLRSLREWMHDKSTPRDDEETERRYRRVERAESSARSLVDASGGAVTNGHDANGGNGGPE